MRFSISKYSMGLRNWAGERPGSKRSNVLLKGVNAPPDGLIDTLYTFAYLFTQLQDFG